MMPTLNDLDKLPVSLIREFRKTGISHGIPAHIQKYILQLDKVAEIRNVQHTHNISTTAQQLMEYFPELSYKTARRRVEDAINYFHLNSSVKEEAWNNYYADRMEDAAKYAIASDNITEFRRCMEKAREYRINATNNSINPDKFKPVIQLISPNVDTKRLGFKEEFNLKTLWKDTEGFIKQLPVDDRDKERALDDARDAIGFEDVDYEEV